MKVFVLGLIVGSVAFFAVERSLLHRATASAVPSVEQQGLGRAIQTSELSRQIHCPESIHHSSDVRESSSFGHSAPSENTPARSLAIDDIQTSVNGTRIKEILSTLSDSDLQELCTERIMRQQRREQAARDAEQKDPAWAYAMEQMVRQHLDAKLQRHPIENLKIDCRTTFCEITCQGYSEQDLMVFQREVQAMTEEPWAALALGEISSMSDGHKWNATFRAMRETEPVNTR